MKTFKTKEGLELQLMDLQGKDYLAVNQRILWFRSEKPDWAIETELIAEPALVKATIKDATGKTLATAHKSIGSKRFPIESGETGAIGRALAMCGYGTQFCGDELDEGDEIADSPIESKKPIPLGQIVKEYTPGRTEKPRDSNWVGGPTEAQLKRLYAISKRFGWTTEDVKTYLGSMGLESSKELNQLQYQKLCQLMEAYPKGGTDGGQDNGGSKSSD